MMEKIYSQFLDVGSFAIVRGKFLCCHCGGRHKESEAYSEVKTIKSGTFRRIYNISRNCEKAWSVQHGDWR